MTFNEEGNVKATVYDEDKGPLTVESGKAFWKDAVEGTYQSYKRSEPLPDNSGNALKKVVHKNYNDIVNDPTKDVLVEFYCAMVRTLPSSLSYPRQGRGVSSEELHPRPVANGRYEQCFAGPPQRS
jgi:hypothetical protein